jgi:acetyl-CoA carboxylase biotin carboxyl carrier protein
VTTRDRGSRADGRTTAERGADHAAIDRLTHELLPALVARLGATGLGELEVREGSWRVRLRRPAATERRPAQGGRAIVGRAQRTSEERRDGGPGTSVGPAGGPAVVAANPPATSDTEAAELPPLTSVGETLDPRGDGLDGTLIAFSPAVGIFRAAQDVPAGTRVRSGDRLGAVDLLGVPQEVVAPADGFVADALVEDGDAVEYGQPLVSLEPVVGDADRPLDRSRLGG